MNRDYYLGSLRSNDKFSETDRQIISYLSERDKNQRIYKADDIVDTWTYKLKLSDGFRTWVERYRSGMRDMKVSFPYLKNLVESIKSESEELEIDPTELDAYLSEFKIEKHAGGDE